MKIRDCLIGCLLVFAITWTAAAGGWFIEGGVTKRFGCDVSIRGSSHTQMEGVHAASAFDHEPSSFVRMETDVWRSRGEWMTTTAPDIGDTASFGDRTYDNGYVNIDLWTFMDGQTWFWGYDSAEQYDTVNHTLAFNATRIIERNDTVTGDGVQSGTGSRRTVTTDVDASSSGAGDFDMAGVSVSGGYDFRSEGKCSFSVVGGVNVLDGDTASISGSTFGETILDQTYERVQRYPYVANETYVQQRQVTDYFLGPNPLPPAPFAGEYAVLNPTIPETPEYRTEGAVSEEMTGRTVTRGAVESQSDTVTASSSWRAWNEVNVSVDPSVQEFWLGARWTMQLCSRSAVAVTPMLTCSRCEADATRTERFVTSSGDVLNSWSDSSKQRDWIFGAGVQVGLKVYLTSSLFLDVGGAYNWSENQKVDVGPSMVEVDYSGYSANAALGLNL